MSSLFIAVAVFLVLFFTIGPVGMILLGGTATGAYVYGRNRKQLSTTRQRYLS